MSVLGLVRIPAAAGEASEPVDSKRRTIKQFIDADLSSITPYSLYTNQSIKLVTIWQGSPVLGSAELQYSQQGCCAPWQRLVYLA